MVQIQCPWEASLHSEKVVSRYLDRACQLQQAVFVDKYFDGAYLANR